MSKSAGRKKKRKMNSYLKMGLWMLVGGSCRRNLRLGFFVIGTYDGTAFQFDFIRDCATSISYCYNINIRRGDVVSGKQPQGREIYKACRKL